MYINSYSNLTIDKYLELQEIFEDETLDNYGKNVAVTSVLTDISEEDLLNVPISEFNRLYQNSAFLMEKPKKKMIAQKYKIGDYELIPVYDVSTMTTAQFIDYQEYVKDIEKNTVGILSVFLIPKGKIYNQDYDIDDVQKAIRENMSIEDALALSAFFFLVYKSWLKAMLTYLTKTLKKLKRKKMIPQEQIEEIEKQIQVLRQNGDGLR